MSNVNTKKKLAMMLCVLMLATGAASFSLAEGAELAAEGVQDAAAVQLIVPPAADVEEPTPKPVAAPDARVSTHEDAVTVEIIGEKGLAIYADLSGDTRLDLRNGDVIEFSGLKAGEYDLEVDYHDVQKGVSAFRTSVSVAGKKAAAEPVVPEVVVPEVVAPPAAVDAIESPANDQGKKTVAAPGATWTISGDSVSITITGEAGLRMYVDATVGWDDEVYAGETVTFLGLEAGKRYGIEVDYYDLQEGVSAYRTSFDVPEDSQGSEQITPPASEETTPPPSVTTPPVQVITPPPTVSDGPQSVKQFSMEVVNQGGMITAQITGASEREVDVALIKNDSVVSMRALIGNGSVSFEGLSDGVYTVRAAYVTPAEGIAAVVKTVEIKGIGSSESVPAEKKPTVMQLGASVSSGDSWIEIKVTEADPWPLYVAVGSDYKVVSPGETARFDHLSAGEYDVEVDYVEPGPGVSPFRSRASVAKAPVGIAITGVAAGENVITVTGTAQPGADIALTTTPAASAATIVRADSKGAFAANITLQAGTYTQVRTVYVADNTVTAVANGVYIVTAPVTRPKLSVDPVSDEAMQVLATTTPGVTVSLRVQAYNYAQTLVADSRGLLKYSLPQTYPKGTVLTFTVFYGVNNAQSYVQTLTVSAEKTYPLLQYGDTGDAVEKLTDRLEDLGYLADESRRYSSAVREAVKLFQKFNGLDADGIADSKTQRALFSSGAIPYGASGVYPTLTRGDKGLAAIDKLQRRLKELGYYTIAVDAIYGSGTERAVRHFQRINGLSKTGVADNATQQLLYSSSAKKADSAEADNYKVLSRSSQYHSAVVPLQRRLKELGYAVGSADGYFGSRTYRAVREFQKRNGLKVTGIADEAMQRVLFSSSAIAASGSSSSSSGVSYRLLSWGSTGDDVKRLQNALLAAGYKQVRVADGIYGEWTYDAVRAFQKDRGLAVDGIAGKDTQGALYGVKY